MVRWMVVLCAPAAAVAAPTTLGFDGRLTDTAGTPLNGAQIVDIALHTDPVVDTEVWQEQHGVTAADGYFHVDLGRTNQTLPSVLASHGELWAEVRISNQALTPRTPLHAAPYSITDSDTLADLSCSTGDSIRWDGSGWACDPQPQITTFRCEPAQWSVGANAQICSTTITPTVDSLVVTTANGHWQSGSSSQWCIVEIQYPGEGSYYTGNSPYVDQKGSAHGYPEPSWDAFSVTRALTLPGGQTHTISLYVSENTGGSCTVNGSSLHGWVIPL